MNGIKEVEEHVPVEQAWNELEEINRELEKFAESRAVTEKELETCRQRSVALENVRFFLKQYLTLFEL